MRSSAPGRARSRSPSRTGAVLGRARSSSSTAASRGGTTPSSSTPTSPSRRRPRSSPRPKSPASTAAASASGPTRRSRDRRRRRLGHRASSSRSAASSPTRARRRASCGRAARPATWVTKGQRPVRRRDQARPSPTPSPAPRGDESRPLGQHQLRRPAQHPASGGSLPHLISGDGGGAGRGGPGFSPFRTAPRHFCSPVLAKAMSTATPVCYLLSEPQAALVTLWTIPKR